MKTNSKKSSNHTSEDTQRALREEIAAIKTDFDIAEREYTKAAEKQYYQYARWYLYWQKVTEQHSDFLKSEYEKAGLNSLRKTDNVEFRRFVSYSLGIPAVSNTETNKITHYTYLLQGLHREISFNREKYSTKATDKIVELLTNAEGKHKFVDAEKALQQAEGTGVSLTPAQLNAAQKKAKKLAAAAKKIAQANIEKMKTSASAIKAQIDSKTDIETDAEELVVFVGRKKKTGGYNVLATSNNSAIINQILGESITHGFTSMPVILRQISEFFIIQHYPQHGKPSNIANQQVLRNKILLEQSNLTTAYLQDFDDATDERVLLSAPPRLLFMPKNNEIILSNTRTKVGVFIMCRPNQNYYAGKKDVYLQTRSRIKLDEWFDSYALQQIETEQSDTLDKVKDKSHQYVLNMHNTATDESDIFYFYERDLSPSNPLLNMQSYYKHHMSETAWHMKVDLAWIKNLSQNHFAEWFGTLGYFKQLKRDNNETHVLCISEHLFEIHFNFDINGKGAKKYFDAHIHIDWEQADTEADYIEMEFKSKDIATVMYNLCELPITGDVKISGNKHALIIEYKTKIGSYLIAVPTLAEYAANSDSKIETLFTTV